MYEVEESESMGYLVETLEAHLQGGIQRGFDVSTIGIIPSPYVVNGCNVKPVGI